MIYLNMPVGELYGWAVCGKNLLKSLTNKVQVGYIESIFGEQVREKEDDEMVWSLRVDDCINFGTVIHTLTPAMKPSCCSWGNRNIGSLFHEKPYLSKEQIHNLKRFDVVIAGSEWNAEIIGNCGIKCHAIQQGVDQKIFKYKPRKKDDKFVIFSGGKWETRKGQKLVIEAFKRLYEKHKDVVLIASWDNLFDQNASKEIRDSIHDVKNILHIGLQTHKNLANFIYETDVGVFPNTFEGGTNLVLMEYLSCGRAAIANVDTGQKDVISDDYAYGITGSNLVDDIYDRLIYCYDNRDELHHKGKIANKAMGYFSWERMAERYLSL